MTSEPNEHEMNKDKSRKTSLRWDERTQRFCAKLGRKNTSSGNTDGHLFRFSANERESERRKGRIQDLWDTLVDAEGGEHLWTPESLKVAKALAEGKSTVEFSIDELAPKELLRVFPLERRCRATHFAVALGALQSQFPMVNVVPTESDADSFESGKTKLATKAEKASDEGEALKRLTGMAVVDRRQPTVMEAIEKYEEYIENKLTVIPDTEEGLSVDRRLSDTAVSYLRQFKRIKQINAKQMSWPISRLTYQGCDEMLEVWRQRPLRNDKSGPMAVKTCREHAKRIKEFLRWLSKTDEFDWKKPLDFDELKLGIRKSGRDKASLITSGQQVRTFTVEELVILNQYANPHERFVMLCGLNCGFKRMEIGTLRVGELSTEEMHPHAKFVDFKFTGTESFIRRFRTKTEVFGEWYLWPLTVTGMKWAIERRKQQTEIVKGQGAGMPIPYSSDALLYLNDCGHSFTKKTASGNPNNQLTNAWNRLLRRVRKDYPEFRWLPHEALRDTAANWIRGEFGGEIAEVFLSHGAPIGSRKSLVECYTNKPFGRLFDALKWLEQKLQPVFEATPENPFPEDRKLGGGGLTLKQQRKIKRLADKKVPVREIARRVNCSITTVYRQLRQNDQK